MKILKTEKKKLDLYLDYSFKKKSNLFHQYLMPLEGDG